MKLIEIFTDERGRLRSGWRVAVFLLALTLLLTILGAISGALFYYLAPGISAEHPFVFIIPNLTLLFASILVGWLCGRFLEGLPFAAFGAWFTQNWLKDFIIGLMIGAASIGFAVLICVVSGAMSLAFNQAVAPTAILLTLAVSLGVFAIGAAAEEALFRGYVLQTFGRANLAWLAILLTSVVFGLGHLGNPNVNYIAAANTILAGVWFSLAYLRTRTLWLPFGLHLAWNWVQGAVFGIPVSGITSLVAAPLLQPMNTGSKVLTGGDYGIEGGVACTIAVIIFILLTWFLPIFKSTEEVRTENLS